MFGVGWYVDNEALRHMNCYGKIFNKFHKQEGGMQVELGDDATYLVKGFNSISFLMPSLDVFVLNDVLIVPSLKKNLSLVSCITYFQCRVSFEGQQSIINDFSLSSLKTLTRGVRDGGLYKLLVDHVEIVHGSKMLRKPSSFEKDYEKN